MIAAARRLLADRRAATLVEFALCLPLFVTLIAGCVEYANYSIAREQVSQLALMVADNASRMGSQDVLRNKPITEGDIEDVFTGAAIQSGGLKVQDNGRIILSSLEYKADGSQWIHWQRCFGGLSYPSSYGKQGDGMSGTSVTGMGPANGRVQARDGMPVMFVEVAATYVPIIMASFVPSTRIVETAALIVRDDRDLNGTTGSGVNPTFGRAPRYCA